MGAELAGSTAKAGGPSGRGTSPPGEVWLIALHSWGQSVSEASCVKTPDVPLIGKQPLRENAQAGVCWGRHPLQTCEAMGAVRRPQRLHARWSITSSFAPENG